MIERYTRPEMGAIWSERQRIDAWLAVEKAVCEAWNRRGRIPDSAMPAIRAATCDIERMRQIEREVDHDVIAFLRATGESIGRTLDSSILDSRARRGRHSAGPASDCRHRPCLGRPRRLDCSRRSPSDRSSRHADDRPYARDACRTDDVRLKLAVWYDELRRQRRRLDLAREDIAVGKISGAVGTHAHVPPELEEEVCRALGLGRRAGVDANRPARSACVLAGRPRGHRRDAGKVAIEIRHLQRSEVGEVEEPFDPGNQGSSAMPHKRNPHASERITGLARLLRGYATTAAENNALWHERDISHSSTERVIMPDAFIVLDFMLHEMSEILERSGHPCRSNAGESRADEGADLLTASAAGSG